MPNTKAVGVAYADPQFDSVTVTGASTLAAVTATTVTASGAITAGVSNIAGITTTAITVSGNQVISNANAGLYFLSTAIEANTTVTTAPKGSIATTTNATGAGKLFISDGSKWQFAAIS